MADRIRVRARPRIERLWRNDLAWYEAAMWAPLAPAAVLYRGALAMRSAYWRLMRRRVSVLTISVGNLTVGGNCKTPFTLYLAERLSARGLRVGIVSRGFGGRIGNVRAALVSNGGRVMMTPEQAGDEPAMMAQSFSGPIAVARRRIHGIELLRRVGPLDIAILDDAFQHVRLARDLDLLLVNARRGVGNGWMLPAGPMREPLWAMKRAHAVILMDTGGGPLEPSGWPARAANGSPGVLLRASVRPRSLIRPESGQWQEFPLALAGKRVFAVSGLADPAAFNASVRALGADLVGTLEYPDHHAYTATDWETIASAARGAEMVLTTEKDLVKLQRFQSPAGPVYALRLEVSMGEDEARLLEMIGRCRQRATLVSRE
jgi:tetraacyldisaccharide 4'-kinase